MPVSPSFLSATLAWGHEPLYPAYRQDGP